jgi:dipeptidyl aminopeptidase/acylaminoacyl peptidase
MRPLCVVVALTVVALATAHAAHAGEPVPVERIAYGTHQGDAVCIADAKTLAQACINLPEPAYVDNIAWSPDGKLIAAVGQTYRTDPVRFIPRLFLISADATALPGTDGPVRLVGRDDAGVGAPAWAPDGSFVYVATPTHLLGLEIATGLEKYLATWPAGAGFGTGGVSPDGTKIVIDMADANGQTVMALLSLTDSSVRVIREFGVRGAAFGGATWSPDGSRILFTSLHDEILPDGAHALASQIYTIAADGSDERLLYTGEPTGVFLHARYSPDGSRIALEGFANGQLDVFIIDVSGENVRNVTNSSLEAREPQWSPDGRTLLYRDATCNCLRTIDVDDPAAEPRDLFQGLTAAWAPVPRPLPAGSEPPLLPVPATPTGDATPRRGLDDAAVGIIGPETGTGSPSDGASGVTHFALSLLMVGVLAAALGISPRRT